VNGLDFDITPEPTPDEAAALIAAVEQALAEDGPFAPPAAGASAWRRAGSEEACE
jgi:hypothetical protein